MIKLASWNVNGIRAAAEKGFFEWLDTCDADIIGLQETKAQEDQLGEEFLRRNGYKSYFASAQKKGYSGTALYSRIEAKSITPLGAEEFDAEGRGVRADFGDFVLFNCYFPNSQDKGARLTYKLAFCDYIKNECDKLQKEGKEVLVCGDYNIAHKPIDLEYPDANVENPGYLPEERAWLDSFEKAGYLDSFRLFSKEAKQYSWWSYRTRARDRNIGWRLDYFWLSPGLLPRVKNAAIHSDIFGSDHCPVSIVLD